jgi:hypothetical protein
MSDFLCQTSHITRHTTLAEVYVADFGLARTKAVESRVATTKQSFGPIAVRPPPPLVRHQTQYSNGRHIYARARSGWPRRRWAISSTPKPPTPTPSVYYYGTIPHDTHTTHMAAHARELIRGNGWGREMMARKRPWAGVEGAHIVSSVTANARPQIPKDCDPMFRQIIKQCWKHNPSRRYAHTAHTSTGG